MVNWWILGAQTVTFRTLWREKYSKIYQPHDYRTFEMINNRAYGRKKLQDIIYTTILSVA